MTPRKRIFWNVIATYGRSVYSLFLGLFTARWALNALGHVDYGLMGLVGGLTAFMAFLNGLMAFSIGRFYGVNVGKTLIEGKEREGVEECRKWFNSALLMHTSIPLVLLIVGYPVGEWAVRCFLAIPVDRVSDCVWVWRFTCVSCFVSMASVPFTAMYSAKQDIAEMTIYGFATATLNALFLGYMITHPGVWLVKFALFGCGLGVIVATIQIIRAICKYEECRFVRRYLWNRGRFVEICKFSLARFWTMFSGLINAQGDAIMVNKFLGPAFNASMALASSAASHTATLSGALTGAFWPAIMNLAGKGDREKVIDMSYRLCRLGTLLMMIFALPLMLELPYILKLWLKMPPPFVAEICFAILFTMLMERMSEGLYMPIMSLGLGIARYSWFIGWGGLSHFALAIILFFCGVGMHTVCVVYVLTQIIIVSLRLYLAKSQVGMSVRYWIRNVCVPIATLGVLTAGGGLLTHFMGQSFARLVLTAVICELVLLIGSWRYALNNEERAFVLSKLSKIPWLKKSN